MNTQLEDLEQVLSFINLRHPLNRLGGWAASADFIKIVYREILKKIADREKILVVECGSGVSTILIAYLLQKYSPQSKLIAFDHSYDYCTKTSEELHRHGLAEYVELLYAPLRYYTIEGKEWLWYEMSEFSIDGHIEIVVVDGPPMTTQAMARYPVLPLLRKYMTDETTIVLDDADREEERRIVDEWLREEKDLRVEFAQTQKGTAKLFYKINRYEPLITIAIPTYNRSKWLQESLLSALDQNYPNYEIIVVDDGSRDETKKLMEQLNNAKIKFFSHEVNRGRSEARNTCIDNANGEYILWLGDDDRLVPNILQRYVDLLNDLEPKPEVIYGNLQGFEGGNYFLQPEDFYKNSKTLLQKLMNGNGSYITDLGSLVKKEIYEKYGQYDKRFKRAQDFELWIRVSKNATFKKLNEVVAYWRVHAYGASGLNTTTSADRSYESLAMRIHLARSSFEEIYYHLHDVAIMKQKFSNALLAYFDGVNGLYYGFEYVEKNPHIAKQKFIQALQCDNMKIAKFALQYLSQNERESYTKILKKYEKLRKLASRGVQLSSDAIGLNNSWLWFYTEAMRSGDMNSKKEYARAAYLLSPFNPKSKELATAMGVDVHGIDERILSIANNYEEKKSKFMEEFWK